MRGNREIRYITYHVYGIIHEIVERMLITINNRLWKAADSRARKPRREEQTQGYNGVKLISWEQQGIHIMKYGSLKALLVFIICFAAIALAGRALAQSWLSGSTGGDYIALIHVAGMITSGGGGGGLMAVETGAGALDICSQLYEAKDDDACVAVLLRVDSPGGSAAASQEIYSAIKAVREAGKPVVVSMGDVAASGGYYVSAPADYIFANGSTLTGSIGVVFQLMNWEEAAKKIGVDDTTLTAGEFKDIGSPWRDMTATEQEMLAALMKQVHEQFIQAVIKGRTNLTEEQVRALATGMIFTGEQAVGNGLVDELGGLHEAVAKARSLAGVGEDVPVQEQAAGSFLEELLGLSAPRLPNSLSSIALEYLQRDPLVWLSQGMALNTTLRDLSVR
jgi:protease IV